MAIQADSADPEQVAKVGRRAVAQLGGLDILVNNAGVAYLGDVETLPLEQFDRLVAINVRAASSPRSSALFRISARRRAIINIGSINADRVPGPGLSVYAMTKGSGRRVDPWACPRPRAPRHHSQQHRSPARSPRI